MHSLSLSALVKRIKTVNEAVKMAGGGQEGRLLGHWRIFQSPEKGRGGKGEGGLARVWSLCSGNMAQLGNSINRSKVDFTALN